MSKPHQDSTFPPDKYDDVAPYNTELGAHRADFEPKTGVGQLIGIIIAAGIALSIGVVSFLLLPQLSGNDEGSQPAADQSAPAEGKESTGSGEPADESAEASVSSEGNDGESGGDGSDDASGEGENTGASEATDPTAEADKSLPVEVFNASGISGRAGQAAEQLTQEGFNVTGVRDWDGRYQVTENTVFYSEDEATAQALADILGATVEHRADGEPMLVVLAQ